MNEALSFTRLKKKTIRKRPLFLVEGDQKQGLFSDVMVSKSSGVDQVSSKTELTLQALLSSLGMVVYKL